MFIPTVMIASTILAIGAPPEPPITDNSPLGEKAAYFQRDLLQKHWLDGLYVSIVPSTPEEIDAEHTVNLSGNVIHAGVWTGRYLAGVGYQYAVTRDAFSRQHGNQILRALRVLQEVTGKRGLLARGYVKGHGPVPGWETDGRDSVEWHQGQGKYADYRWYGDVSVDNFNAVLYGYAVYYDLAADDEQRRLMRSVDESDAGQPDMTGWRIGLADSFFVTPWGLVASGPGGVVFRKDGDPWTEWKIWEESETGAADYLHAYWLGRYYGFVKPDLPLP